MDNEGHDSVRWYLRPAGVLLLLFVVLGPLALPLLYKSPRFSRGQKIALTVLVLGYTLFLILGSVELAMEVIRTLDEFQNFDLSVRALWVLRSSA
jgi:hypothetical protein